MRRGCRLPRGRWGARDCIEPEGGGPVGRGGGAGLNNRFITAVRSCRFYCALRCVAWISSLRTTVRPGEPHLHYSNPRYIKICQNALPASLRTPSCISHDGPSEIRAPTPRAMRARSLCSQCATPCSTWTASYTRAQRPPMQGCLYSLCVLALRSTSHATRPPAARAEVCGEVGVTISPRASTRGCY